VQLFHYRDRDQVEVDMVLEHAAGTVIGIEVKAAETIRAEDFAYTPIVGDEATILGKVVAVLRRV